MFSIWTQLKYNPLFYRQKRIFELWYLLKLELGQPSVLLGVFINSGYWFPHHFAFVVLISIKWGYKCNRGQQLETWRETTFPNKEKWWESAQDKMDSAVWLENQVHGELWLLGREKEVWEIVETEGGYVWNLMS